MVQIRFVEFWCVVPEFDSSQPAVMGKVLGIVYRTIATHLIQIAELLGRDKSTISRELRRNWGLRGFQ